MRPKELREELIATLVGQKAGTVKVAIFEGLECVLAYSKGVFIIDLMEWVSYGDEPVFADVLKACKVDVPYSQALIDIGLELIREYEVG